MQVTIHEAAPPGGSRGFAFADVLGIVCLTAVVAGLAGLVGGVKLGESEKEREMNARFGIVDSTPTTPGHGPFPRRQTTP